MIDCQSYYIITLDFLDKEVVYTGRAMLLHGYDTFIYLN